MSIDTYVFPTVEKTFSINNLNASIRSLLEMRMAPETIPHDVVVNRNDEPILRTDESFYQISTGRSLYLSSSENDENQMYFLKGQAGKVSNAKLREIADKNEFVGYSFTFGV